MAQLNMTGQGPGNSHMIQLAYHEPKIFTDTPTLTTYLLLYNDIITACATVSSHILSHTAIYRYMALHYYGCYNFKYITHMGIYKLCLSDESHFARDVIQPWEH